MLVDVNFAKGRVEFLLVMFYPDWEILPMGM